MTGIILLAAGSSSRLGQPKQQLPYSNKTLLQHAIETAIASEGHPVVVVIGANAEATGAGIETYNIHIVENPSWQEGMSTSIKCGIQKLLSIEPLIDSAIIMVCDQPYVDTNLLNNLIHQRSRQDKPIISSAYNNTLGVPALFDRSFFQRLTELQGPEGAKKIIFNYKDLVASVSFPLGNIDIDTIDDYKKLLG